MAETELRVHPRGWASSPESERFPITLMGHLMPKVYVLIVEVFSLLNDADRDAITKNMVAGLELALSQYPMMVGVLKSNPESGELWIEKARESTVTIHVKHVESGEDLPSYAELEKRDFPAKMLDGSRLLPKTVVAKQLFSPLGNNDEEGIPISTFQLNYIQGGLILGVAVHHALSDAPGCDGFLTNWAENSTAVARGSSQASVETPFIFKGSALDVQKPTREEADKLRNAFPLLRVDDGPMPPPSADFKMPQFSSQMIHFPKSKADALKMRVSSGLKTGWISTYDAIMALVWSRVTIARLPLSQADPDTEVIFVGAVDTRNRWEPPLPERFLGVAAWGARSEPLVIRDVVAPKNLSELAKRIRASNLEFTAAYLTRLLQWVASQEDKRYIAYNFNAFLGMDFGGTSWASIKAYEKHDFGFGCPKALRWPNPQVDGYSYVYPSRAVQKEASADEGVEMCVCLEEGCMERLRNDEVLLTYAQLRD